MPNTNILGFVEGESENSPKKFKNIDIEPFEFTWDGKPFGGSLPERVRSYQEEVIERDIQGNPRRDDKGEVISRMVTRYEILKRIEPGETVLLPKYLVNFAAMHLAKKMYKRTAITGKSDVELRAGIYKLRNPEEEMKLQKQMVVDNFEQVLPESSPPEPTPEPTIPTEEKKEEEKKLEEVSNTCEICGKICKNKVGKLAHKRFKHKQ